jgi:hypothetical protein
MASDAPCFMEHHFRVDDFRQRLDPAISTPRRKSEADRNSKQLELIERELSFGAIREQAQAERYPVKQVYVDIVPVSISAIVRVFTAMRQLGVNFNGFDANAYKAPFTDELKVDLSTVSFKAFKMHSLAPLIGRAF